ncbi:MAG: T9SS type A sorting domain-containing protein, partial [Bacteroidetes bacterium]|nr:T9SS type A sorting domain-containing protein [Bacteroidota bacterium]
GGTGYTGKLYKTRIGSPLTGIGQDPSPSDGFSLDQNFPNPFGRLTSIGFAIPERCFVTLKVYDVLGNVIATLVNGIEQPGIKSLQFDGDALSDGIYYYQLRTEDYTSTKKFVLRR